jgi:CRISPR/Cas system-associated exonuclease Cas4 (RecB family)
MPHGAFQAVTSRSTGPLIAAAAKFLESLNTSGVESVLVAPTHSAGEELAHRLGKLRGVHRLTLLQLALECARPEMAERGLGPLSTLGSEALAARVVHAERAEKELEYFEGVAGMKGFARALARTISELRLARVGADHLRGRGPAGSDLARLLTRFEAELVRMSLADTARVFELAAHAEGASRWEGLPVVILDVALPTLSQREFLARVVSKSPRVFAAVLAGNDAAVEILGVKATDLDAKKPASTLEHLRRYLFSEQASAAQDSGQFEIFSAPGEGLEAVEIARRILHIAAGGTRFDQVAILLRNVERYQPMVEDALRRARVPAYFSRGTARPDPGGRAFLALLACAAEKCSATRFAEYLSLGQVPAAGSKASAEWVPPDDEMLPAEQPEIPEIEIDESRVARAPASWERLLTDAAVIGGRERWSRRLKGLEREFELHLKTIAREDEGGREELLRRLGQLRELEGFALPLIDTLWQLPTSARWSEWIEKLSNLARMSLRRPEPVLAVLAEFEPMGDVGPAMLDEVAAVLSERLRFLRRDPPQRRYGRVFVGSIDEARGREFPVVFLPGLAEGLFPQRSFEDPLLLDNFRRELGDGLPLRDDRTREERERLQLACATARDRLIASYPRMDVAEARPRVPSFYALELPRAIEGRLPRLREFEKRTREASPARLNWPAPSDAATAIDDTEYDLATLASAPQSARYVLESNAALARSLRGRWRRWESPKWSEPDGLITHDRAALEVLATKRLKAKPWSASSLQQFSACPYRFALHGIFGIRPREEAVPIEQMDPLTRGGLFHEVQFALLNALQDQKLLPVNPQNLAQALELADRALDAVAGKYKEELAPAVERVWVTEIEDLRTDLRGWLQHISVNDAEWQPIHFEFAFGLPADSRRDAASTNEVAQLDSVMLRGSIDLVERHVSRGALRVTDHKTGKLPETTPHMVGGGRYLQPLLYGMAAEKMLGATVECGRLFFATQQGGYQTVEIPVDERRRAFLSKLLSNIDASIEGGFLPAAPQKDVCKNCDYRDVCGPNEEKRFAVKDRRDERLEALIEIRGMA